MTRKNVWLMALSALIITGCAGHDELSVQKKQDDKTFWNHRYQYVRLVPQDHCQGADTTANSHPQDLGNRLRTALASLRIDQPEKEKTAPVFTYSELQQIEGPLLQAFKQASPTEDVGLSIEGMHPGDFGIQRCIITARLFIQNEDELHVIFGKLHEPVDDYKAPMHMSFTDYRTNPYLPGSRCENAYKKFPAIIPTQIIRFHEQESAPRKNWLVVSLSAQPPASPPMPMTAPPAYQAAPQPAPPAYQTAPQAAPPAYQAAPPAARDATRMTPAPALQSDRTILERLQILKDLRVQGLITEQEYQEKKKAILDSL